MAAVMVSAKDDDAAIFEATEAALHAWGSFRRRTTARLGLPTMSPIAQMIDHVKVFEQRRAGARKPLKRSKLVKLNKNADAKAVSLELRHADKQEAHSPDQKPSRKPMAWPALAMRVEAGVNRADYQHRRVLIQSYLFRRPDSKAAQNMRIRAHDYRLMRLAAVAWLADYLMRRGSLPVAKQRLHAL